eukprot:gene9745-64794_t
MGAAASGPPTDDAVIIMGRAGGCGTVGGGGGSFGTTNVPVGGMTRGGFSLRVHHAWPLPDVVRAGGRDTAAGMSWTLEQSERVIPHLEPLLPAGCAAVRVDAAKLGVPQNRVRCWAGTAEVVNRLAAVSRPLVPAAHVLPNRDPQRFAIENRVCNHGGKKRPR